MKTPLRKSPLAIPIKRRAPHRMPDSPVPRLLAHLSVMIGIGTALLFYLGWVVTQTEAHVLGYDISEQGLGTADYLLVSLSLAFPLLLLTLLVTLTLRQIHQKLLAKFLERGRREVVLRIARLLSLAPVLMAPLATLLLLTPFAGYVMPSCSMTAILLVMYGRSIRRRRTGTDPWSPVVFFAVVLLLGLSAFWTAERLARFIGTERGEDLAKNPKQLPAVVLYSKNNLLLNETGVATEELGQPHAAYEFRYSGLYLLKQTGSQFLLITDAPVRVIPWTNNADTRMELHRARNSE